MKNHIGIRQFERKTNLFPGDEALRLKAAKDERSQISEGLVACPISLLPASSDPLFPEHEFFHLFPSFFPVKR